MMIGDARDLESLFLLLDWNFVLLSEISPQAGR